MVKKDGHQYSLLIDQVPVCLTAPKQRLKFEFDLLSLAACLHLLSLPKIKPLKKRLKRKLCSRCNVTDLSPAGHKLGFTFDRDSADLYTGS